MPPNGLAQKAAVGPPTTATDVLPNGDHHEALPDKPLLRLHRMALRSEAVPAGPTASFMRLLDGDGELLLEQRLAGHDALFSEE